VSLAAKEKRVTAVEVFSIIQDICVSAAAIVTAIVAWRGLKSWRAELSGRADFEAARSLMKATYNLRDILDACRNPWIRPQELPAGYLVSTSRSAQQNGEAMSHVYWGRWDKVFQFTQEFDSASLEAEALWGSEIEDLSKNVRMCASKLRASIEAFINNEYSGGENFKADNDFAKEVRATINLSTDRKDELSVKLRDAIQEIEKYVRPHLARS
jgi:hypothetical protein